MPGTASSADIDQMSDRVDAALREHLHAGRVTGLTWLLAADGQVRSGAAGNLDPGRGDANARPVTEDTIFRISSMTKPITAAAAMALVDDGRITLEQPIDDLVPELAGRPVLRHPGAAIDDTVPALRPITVDDLLTFRLGHGMDFAALGRPTPLDAELSRIGVAPGPPAPQQRPGPDEWIARLGSVPLRCQPGERWLYHTGADVLSVLIARAAGMPLSDWLAQRIFEPLGMIDTCFAVPESARGRFGACHGIDPASGNRVTYDPPDGQWTRPPAFQGGGDGLVSTVGDFHRFAAMLAAGGAGAGGRRVLSEASVAAMTTNRLTVEQLRRGGPDPDGRRGWGLGMAVQLRPGPLSGVGGYGWDGGLGSVWRTDPGTGVIAVLMADTMWESPALPPVAEQFLRIALAPRGSGRRASVAHRSPSN